MSRWDIKTVLQVIVVVIAILGAVGGGIGAYVAAAVRIAEFDLRLTSLEHAREQDQKDIRAYQDEMRASVARALDLLTDVRLQQARQGGSHAK